jgi:NaMN:DMB phosphoribosyltransferase
VAECVPGGTTTAQAVLTGLGIEVGGIVSGSLHRPAHALKADLVARGLAAAALDGGRSQPGARGAAPDPLAVLAALGDPMQALSAGLLLGALDSGQTVLLAGGSQMAAVLALALALAAPSQRGRLASLAAVGTTAWVADEAASDLSLLLHRIGCHWGVEPLAFAASLRFQGALHSALLDYERGYVKEGVGAGGLAILWELAGRSPTSLALACDRACSRLLGPSPFPASCTLPGTDEALRSAHG